MLVLGSVLKVRESSFKGNDGKVIAMLYVDVYDDTCGLVQCETRVNGVMPVKGDKVTAEVLRIKQMKFGSGFSLVVNGLKVDSSLASASSVSAALPVPPVRRS